jgi:transketolase
MTIILPLVSFAPCALRWFLIRLDGDTAVAFTEDVMKRYEAYGWHVQHVENGNDDLEGIEAAIKAAQAVKDKPSLIKVTTIIGYGSLEQGTHGVHGSPLKANDMAQLKEKFGFDPNSSFVVPQKVYDQYHAHSAEGAAAEQEWNTLFEKYAKEFPSEAADIKRRLAKDLPEGWQKALPTYKQTDPAVATRKLSEAVITALHDVIPEIMSGSADLTGSNNTVSFSHSAGLANGNRFGKEQLISSRKAPSSVPMPADI